jgi:hypothetical protein
LDCRAYWNFHCANLDRCEHLEKRAAADQLAATRAKEIMAAVKEQEQASTVGIMDSGVIAKRFTRDLIKKSSLPKSNRSAHGDEAAQAG